MKQLSRLNNHPNSATHTPQHNNLGAPPSKGRAHRRKLKTDGKVFAKKAWKT
jgi:hypothetical protein